MMKNRRHFLKAAGAFGAATLLAPTLVSAAEMHTVQKRKRALRIAHVTDVHILAQENAQKCFARVLEEINSLKDKPDFIINTGDTIMDANQQTRQTVEHHWQTWDTLTSRHNRLDMFSAIGNHDVWSGPDDTLDAEYKKHKEYGKQWAIDRLKLPQRYYSFAARGWRFIALDSINGSEGYQLDDEQFEWLRRELESFKGPVLIYNHVPILSMGAFLYYTKRKPLSDVVFPRTDMHNDHQRIKDLFSRTNNVRLCLSGHIHYVDAVEYLGVKYFCNGAVSGNWWGDPIALDEFPPAYSIIDLFQDGTVNQQLVYYNTRF